MISENSQIMPESTSNTNPEIEKYALELDFIKSSVASRKVVMFSTTYCRWCKVAAGYFKQFDMNINKIEINEPLKHNGQTFTEEQGRNMFGILSQATDNQATVPKVFVCGKYLGGCQEVQATFESGRLEKILDDCKKDERFAE